jgi:hypothetical protein
MLARRAGHNLLAGGIVSLHAHRFGLVHQHTVGNDLGFKAGGAEFLGDILRGLQILGRGGDVRCGSKNLQRFAGKLCAGHGKKALLDGGLFESDGRSAVRSEDGAGLCASDGEEREGECGNEDEFPHRQSKLLPGAGKVNVRVGNPSGQRCGSRRRFNPAYTRKWRFPA